MKRVNSCSSYSQFRKNNPNCSSSSSSSKQLPKQCTIVEIAQLAMQLDNIKKVTMPMPFSLPQQNKYQNVNKIIEEEQEDQQIAAKESKNKVAASKKLKELINCMEGSGSKKQIGKSSKSIENNLTARKDTNRNKDSEQKVGFTKAVRKQDKNLKTVRRMSLTTHNKTYSQSATTVSSRSEKTITIIEKQELIEKIKFIQNKLVTKAISQHNFEQIWQNIDKIQKILLDQ